VFQSTLPRGERHTTLAVDLSFNSFQSTLPRGERHTVMGELHGFHISFNPRSRGGSDTITTNMSGCPLMFQSTLPRGERLFGLILNFLFSVFQSTLPRGERHTIKTEIHPGLVSIHAPAGGATPGTVFKSTGKYVSIHAPAGGATTFFVAEVAPDLFQSTLPRGERLCAICSLRCTLLCFNPRSRGGSDPAHGQA